MKMRIERDSMGEIAVPADKLWGAQTQRSLENFKIGGQKMPEEILRAIVLIKKCCAKANLKAGKLDKAKADAIFAAADKTLAEEGFTQHFPLVVWQTGSGTQTNMNVNEVLAAVANNQQDKVKIHPNDHVNMSQSTNDVFPTAIHVAGALAVRDKLMPALKGLIAEFDRLEKENKGIVKTGRTHLQDATPITFSQEISGWKATLETAREIICDNMKFMFRLPLGGTAVGTGINTPQNYSEYAVGFIAEETGVPFEEDMNKFHGLSVKDGVVALHSALKNLAVGLMKIANDIRWLASGPRAGFGEITIPENEPGSSIMPGKVNPTQCEAITMVATEVMGNDTTVTVAASQGNFELNVYMPVIGFKLIESINILADGMDSFNKNCVTGIKPVKEKMAENLERSLMLATALTPSIGYDKSAAIVKKAFKENKTLKECGVELGYISAKDYDAIIAEAVKLD